MHKVNAGYTLLLRVKDGKVDDAIRLLGELDAHRVRLPFASSPSTHFATITVIPAQSYNATETLPATLLFATSYCGPLRVHIRELVTVMGRGLREILDHCEGLTAGCLDDELEDFLVANCHGDTFYSGMQDMSPEDVRQHRQLRDAIDEFIEVRQANGGFTGGTAATRAAIQDYVRSRPELEWAQQPFAPGLWAWLVFHRRALVVEAGALALLACTVAWMFVDSTLLGAIVVGGWIAFAAFLALVIVIVLSIREAEHEQTFVSQRQSDDDVRALAATQHRAVINEFTLAGPVKEGVLRPVFVRLALWIIARVAEGVPGMPYVGTGIDIPTVATARWISADGGRRVMFISNYTNDGVPYVRDFIETPGGAKRINLSFGFGHGYPKTRWVVLDGALTDPNAYIYALCDHQRTTMFWYGPYHDISIDNIKRNREIREGLFADFDDEEEREWLRKL